MKIQAGRFLSPKNIRYILLVVMFLLVCNAGYPIDPVQVPEPSSLYMDSVEVLRYMDITPPVDAPPHALRLGDGAEWLMGLYQYYASYPIPLSPEASMYTDTGYICILEMMALDIIEPYPEFTYTSATQPTGQMFARMLTGMHNRIEADAFDSWHAVVTVREVKALLAPFYRIATRSMIERPPSVPAYAHLYQEHSLPDRAPITKGQFYSMALRLYRTVIMVSDGTTPEEGLSADAFLSDAPMTRSELSDACEGLLDALAIYFPPSVTEQEAVIEISRLARYFSGRQPTAKEYRSVQNDRSYSWYLDQGDTTPCAEYNCAPCCTAMAVRWYDQSLRLDPSTLRQQNPATGECWTTVDIKSCLSQYGVPYSVAPALGEAAVLASIEEGCLLLFIADLGQGSHTILVKGYRRLGDDVLLTCYDSGSWGQMDALDIPIGQDAEYHIRYLLDILKWNHYLRIPPSLE